MCRRDSESQQITLQKIANTSARNEQMRSLESDSKSRLQWLQTMGSRWGIQFTSTSSTVRSTVEQDCASLAGKNYQISTNT